MAKENFNSFYGMAEKVVLDKDPSTGIFKSGLIMLRTIRRPRIGQNFNPEGKNRVERLAVYSKNPELVRLGMDGIRRGDFVEVRGNFSSQDKERKFFCPDCCKFSIDSLASASYIDPSYVRKVEDAIIDGDTGKVDMEKSEERLYSAYRISNTSIIIGMVCREPDPISIETDERGNNMYRFKFELAVNRVRLIPEDPENKSVDFIWVSTVGEMALDCSERLHKGSIVLVYGAVHTREKDTMFHKKCDYCGKELFQRGMSYEIAPYDILYLENCGEETFRDLDELPEGKPGYMNEVFLLGCVRKSEVKPKRGSFALTMETTQRTFATDENKYNARGWQEFNTPMLISYDSKVQEKALADKEIGDVLFVKGTLVTEHIMQRAKCRFCGYDGDENKIEKHRSYIDPVHILPFYRTKNAAAGQIENRAYRVLKSGYEISNQALVVGVVYDEPTEEQYHHDPASSDTLDDMFEFEICISRTGHALERAVRTGKSTKDTVRVVTYGKWANEAYHSIHKGSAVMINGAFITKWKNNKYSKECGRCHRKFTEGGSDTYLLPYRIEYLCGCTIPETVVTGETGDGESE